MPESKLVTYNPNLEASLNDVDVRHVNGASVVFGSGGKVESCKIVEDYSAVRIDGLGPHQLSPWVLDRIMLVLDVCSLADDVKYIVRDDDDAYSSHVIVIGDNRDFAYILPLLFCLLPFARLAEAEILNIRLSETALTIDDIDKIMPPAPRPPVCRPRYRGQCSICTDDLDEERFVGSCGHSWCLACFTSWVEYPDAFAEKGALVCDREFRHFACEHVFTLAEMRAQLAPATYETMLRNSAIEYINQRPREFRHCPHAGCDQIYRPRTNPACFQCAGCNGTICTSCGEGHDEDTPCKVDAELEGAKEAMGAKNCPSCKAGIVKSDGCNHMACTRCRTHICWVCMATFDHSQPCYDHMALVHGSIDGVTPVDANGEAIFDEDMVAEDEAARAELAEETAQAWTEEEEEDEEAHEALWDRLARIAETSWAEEFGEE